MSTYDDKKNELWHFLIDTGITTEEALQLVTNLNGYNLETLQDVLFIQTGYRTLELYKEYEG